jgi:ABC-type lipoprotein release transport system permease subunit
MISLILKEIASRKINFVFGVIAVITAVAFFVSFYTSSEASNRETVRLTRDMGFNLRIIPKETNMDEFWITGFSNISMPEEYVLRFNKFKDFSYAHLTATLHKKIVWQGMNVILTGISPEIEPSGKKKAPMIFSIQHKTVYLGYEVAKAFNLEQGDTINLFDNKFTIAKTLTENGSDDDIRIFAPLGEVQSMLNMEGKINEIKALDCLCLIDAHTDAIQLLRDQLDEVLPEGKVILNQTIAVAREKQRHMFERYFAMLIPVLLFVAAIWIGILAFFNVKERKQEIGILRALGYGAGKIAWLFFGRALLLGIIGAVLGFVIGTAFSLFYGPDIFIVTAQAIKPIYSLLFWSVIIAPLFTALASFIPTMIAISTDPALTLRDN